MNLKKETTNPNEMKIKDEIVLQGMTQEEVDKIDSKRMRVEAMKEKGEVSFAK